MGPVSYTHLAIPLVLMGLVFNFEFLITLGTVSYTHLPGTRMQQPVRGKFGSIVGK